MKNDETIKNKIKIHKNKGFSKVLSEKGNKDYLFKQTNNCNGGTCPSTPINNCLKGANCIPYCGIKITKYD